MQSPYKSVRFQFLIGTIKTYAWVSIVVAKSVSIPYRYDKNEFAGHMYQGDKLSFNSL